MGVFVLKTSAISTQNTFDEGCYLESAPQTNQEYLKAVEPSYQEYIPLKLSRRMARVIKMSIAASKKCFLGTPYQTPEVIVVGTGHGCLRDTEKFLSDMIATEEGLLSPTAFIQSTHNTIAGQIALLMGCSGDNFTYVHRGHSFENALIDGIMHLEEGCASVLVGGAEEVTPTSFDIISKLGCARTGNIAPANGKPVWGEGVSFFHLSNKPDGAIASIDGLYTFYKPTSQEEIYAEIRHFLDAHNTSTQEISAVIMGYNGEKEDDNIYDQVGVNLFEGRLILRYKNLFGEFNTVSSLAHNLAVNMIRKQQVFKDTVVKGKIHDNMDKILIYSHSQGESHAITLISKCQNSRL